MTSDETDDDAKPPPPEFLVDVWRKIISSKYPYVLFENGTCVMIREPEADMKAQAVALLKEWGPVEVGTSSGDFTVIELDENLGAVVTCHHPDIMAFVTNSGGTFEELMSGLVGRAIRDEDASSLNIIHVEPARL